MDSTVRFLDCTDCTVLLSPLSFFTTGFSLDGNPIQLVLTPVKMGPFKIEERIDAREKVVCRQLFTKVL
jgi:hypothetical protein